MPFLSPNQQCQSTKGKYHIPSTCLPQAHLRSSNICLWPLIAPGYLGGCLPCLSSALWCQYPYCRLVEYSIKIVHCLPLEFSGGLTSSKWTGCEVWCYGVKKWLSGLLKLQHSIKICCICSTTWNSLPTHLRRVENSTAAFGWSLKTHLFSEY